MSSRKIAVVGAGVIGLTTALEIQRGLGLGNVSVTVFTEKTSPNTTGDVSAGLWMPYLLQETPQEKISLWAKATHQMILEFWRKGLAEEVGVSLQPIVTLRTDSSNTDVPSWMSIPLGFSEIKGDYLRHLSKLHQKNYTSGQMFVAFILEPSKYLPYVQNLFFKNGGTLEIRSVDNLDDLFKEGFEVVVNCTGLSSKQLANDDKVSAIRGQISRVVAPWQYHVLLDESDDGNYVIPNADCVILGGTHQEEDYNLNVDYTDKNMILSGCYRMVPPLQNAAILKHQVGLRPGRTQVRIELEPREIDQEDGPRGKKLKRWIVHNYGHGGSGVTLCKGCAVEATQLVREALSQGYFPLSKL